MSPSSGSPGVPDDCDDYTSTRHFVLSTTAFREESREHREERGALFSDMSLSKAIQRMSTVFQTDSSSHLLIRTRSGDYPIYLIT